MTIALSRTLTILLLLLATAVGVALVPLDAVPDSGNSMDADFAEYMEPRLLVLLGSVRDVEVMVSERSRNLLALRAESRRIDALLEQIDTYLTARELSPEEQVVADLYRAGANDISSAMNSATDALSRFDFSTMPGMIPVFMQGAGLIEDALAMLGTEGAERSSYTGISAAWSGGAIRESARRRRARDRVLLGSLLKPETSNDEHVHCPLPDWWR